MTQSQVRLLEETFRLTVKITMTKEQYQALQEIASKTNTKIDSYCVSAVPLAMSADLSNMYSVDSKNYKQLDAVISGWMNSLEE